MWIYKITNNINNKVYIGQTTRGVKERFSRHLNDAMSGRLDTHLARAIRKYGPEHFSVEMISIASNQKELTELEYSWIEYYNSFFEGYNETNDLHKCGGNTYAKKTDEEMNKIKEKIRKTKMGGKNPRATKIKAININTNQIYIYNSMAECKRDLNLPNHVCIGRRCQGIIKKPLNETWQFEYYND